MIEAQKRKHLMQLDKVRKSLTGDVRPSLKLEVKASQLEHEVWVRVEGGVGGEG